MPRHTYGCEMADCAFVSRNFETSVFALSKSYKYSSMIGQLHNVGHNVVVIFLSSYFQCFVFFKSW